jgi:hypothetical protein
MINRRIATQDRVSNATNLCQNLNLKYRANDLA